MRLGVDPGHQHAASGDNSTGTSNVLLGVEGKISSESSSFKSGLADHVRGLEQYARAEVERLHELLQQLSSRNKELSEALENALLKDESMGHALLKDESLGHALLREESVHGVSESKGFIDNKCIPSQCEAEGVPESGEDAGKPNRFFGVCPPLDPTTEQTEDQKQLGDGRRKSFTERITARLPSMTKLRVLPSSSSVGEAMPRSPSAASPASKAYIRNRRSKVAMALNPPIYTVNDLYHEQGVFQQIAKSPLFDNFVMLVVVANAIYLGIDLDMNHGQLIFVLIDQFFCAVFTGEVVIRFLACKNRCTILTDPWFLFDAVLVFMMVFETWLMPVITLAAGASSEGGLASASVLRLLRLVRITRMAKVMRMIPELAIMIKGMVVGLRSVIATCMMLGCITYCFAIVFRQLIGSSAEGQEQFGTVPMAMVSLFVESVMPDNGDTLRLLADAQFLYGVIFTLFLFLTALTVLNMLVGVMCDVMSATAHDKKEATEIEQMTAKLRLFMERTDENFDGMVSRSELYHVLDDEEAVRALAGYGVAVTCLVDDADHIFEEAEFAAGIPFKQFAEMIALYRVSTNTCVHAIFDMRMRFRRSMSRISGRLEALEEKVSEINTHGSVREPNSADEPPSLHSPAGKMPPVENPFLLPSSVLETS
eukprot:TRINITY_DN13349_c0_g2_i1.p1 TRINITY_DN13349_c0_g2~~TRINITY_DN13349_c0_g2_i1.p1  ORF type:complete len:654 (-),score=95.48 TRINITY_DN13349_c0_g2_i1:159-2120(-)